MTRYPFPQKISVHAKYIHKPSFIHPMADSSLSVVTVSSSYIQLLLGETRLLVLRWTLFGDRKTTAMIMRSGSLLQVSRFSRISSRKLVVLMSVSKLKD